MSEENKKNMHVDIELVRQLAAVLDETNLTEIEVERGELFFVAALEVRLQECRRGGEDGQRKRHWCDVSAHVRHQ